jgi:hypothetical protein
MTWAAIIIAIIQLLGPKIAQWLRIILLRASRSMTYRPDGAKSAVQLIDQAIAECPVWMVWRRIWLRRVRSVVADHQWAIEAAVVHGDPVPTLAPEILARYGL